MTAYEEVVTAYSGAFVDELARSGIRDVVVSPGSRSTPLAMLVAEHPELDAWVHADERSAAFFALGMAKAARAPVALLCTSGTAAANYFPAVVEASLARVPLVVLTTDRPHELRDVGAPQAIDQTGLFGSHVKWFQEMALPEMSPAMLAYVRATASRAIATAGEAPAGPVHLNFPFREPFVPLLETDDLWRAGREETKSYVRVTGGRRQLDPLQVDELAAVLSGARRGLIVCGPHDDPAFAPAVVQLAERLSFPLLADPLSQVRYGTHDKALVIDGYDAFLREQAVVRRLAPDVVLRFGAMPVSKALLRYLEAHPSCRQIVVDGGAGWREPTLLAADIVYADETRFCEAIATKIGAAADGPRRALGEVPSCGKQVKEDGGTRLADGRDCTMWANWWADCWIRLNAIAQAEVQRQVAHFANDHLFEGRVFSELAALLPDEAVLYVGNSMPVRDLDTFFANSAQRVRTLANRGANGIDGVVSSALGASTAGGPLVLVIGDVSFYHDLNGLLMAKLYGLKATIILLNNDGGGIFSFLPQAANPKHFETLFGTPLGLDYAHAAALYGASYCRVTDWEAFRRAVDAGVAADGLTIIEVPTARTANAEEHRAIWHEVSDAIKGELTGDGTAAVYPQGVSNDCATADRAAAGQEEGVRHAPRD
ncbi:2-succinyl-5-enolpyruvyl-6-hydroxy-3-cyclohexene-1-carboxylic-acid synthase [Numidum massiliense]|uniref:2-succinyl-5-enolpyruvyl-6-hydroxy-3- cyclohexene-1-carboxylic-acid synthase n=1 Tax=Numidum massiliense TaxID=1522315 RepID=UPI00093D9547|nr:2-succinyl-5-enolpyruvyl-6-hydroxy-3-cyclohexene-1-carboxylic-acid synthase [Numidum massiliense]